MTPTEGRGSAVVRAAAPTEGRGSAARRAAAPTEGRGPAVVRAAAPTEGRGSAARRTAALVLLVAATSGCAERRLVARPDRAPGAGTWTAVWIAGVLLALLVGLLLTLPAWRTRSGARLAVAVLTLQTGAVVVAGIVLAGVAVRSWQLLDKPEDARPSVALVRLSRVDGDTAFFALMVLLLVVGVGLVATVTALSARFAAGSDTLQRAIASSFLAVQVGLCGYALVRLLLGARGLPFLAPSVAAPVLLLALATCWPRRSPPASP